MEVTQTISLDFGKDTAPITIFAKQGDAEARYIEITPLIKGQKYALEAGITARLHIAKPDGTIVLNDATITPETGTIRAELTKQALAVAGIASAEIGLYKGTALLSSQVFFVRIEKRAYSDDAIESTNEYKCLVDALNEVEPAVTKANSATSAANTAAETATTKAAEAEAATVETKAATAAANQVVANSQADIGALRQELTRQKQINKSQDLEIEKLKAAAEGNLYLFKTDSEEAYEKAVPDDVMPYASLDKVGGRTLVWNQLLRYKETVAEPHWEVAINNGEVTATSESASRANLIITDAIFAFDASHVYYIGDIEKFTSDTNEVALKCYETGTGTIFPDVSPLTFNRGMIIKPIQSTVTNKAFFYLNVYSSDSNIIFKAHFMVFDLTLMFGAGNEPSTPEEFRAMFPAEYYPYSEPTLMNFSSSEVVSKGKNLFDPSIFDGVDGITKSGEEYVGKISAFMKVTFTLPPIKTVSMSIDARVENVEGADNIGLVIGVVYKDGSVRHLLELLNSANGAKRYTATITGDKIIDQLYFSYGIYPDNIVHLSNIMITAGSTPEEYIPYRSIPYDTSAIVQKYFPDGMKSAGDVHDEIDFERGVAIQRVGSVVLDGSSTITLSVDSHVASNTDFAYNYAFFKYHELSLPIKRINPQISSSIRLASGTDEGHVLGGIRADYRYDVVYVFIPNVAVLGNTLGEYITAFKNALKNNPVEVNYELETPIETPITEPFEETIEVESGGALTFKSGKGDDYQIPVPNQETYMIKLPNGGTA